MMGIAEFPRRLGGSVMCAAGIIVNGRDVIFDIVIADTAVVTVTSFGFKTDLTAVFAKEHSFGFATAANVAIVEAFAAVLAEMRVVLAVLDAERGRIDTVGVTLTAVKAKLAGLTHLHRAECISAIGAEMIVPIGVFNAKFSAITALGLCVVYTAVNAETAILAKIDAVLK